MKTFVLAAVLKRTVLDDVSLSVRASSLDHAYHIARDFLRDYPENTGVFKDTVKFCLVENRTNIDSETVDINHEDKEHA